MQHRRNVAAWPRNVPPVTGAWAMRRCVIGPWQVYLRLDQPNTALDLLVKGAERNPHETQLLIGIARPRPAPPRTHTRTHAHTHARDRTPSRAAHCGGLCSVRLIDRVGVACQDL